MGLCLAWMSWKKNISTSVWTARKRRDGTGHVMTTVPTPPIPGFPLVSCSHIARFWGVNGIGISASYSDPELFSGSGTFITRVGSDSELIIFKTNSSGPTEHGFPSGDSYKRPTVSDCVLRDYQKLARAIFCFVRYYYFIIQKRRLPLRTIPLLKQIW